MHSRTHSSSGGGSDGLVVCECPSEVHIVVRENGYAYIRGGKIEIDVR